MTTLASLAQQGGGGGTDAILMIVMLVVVFFVVAGLWKTYAKAGQPGWLAIIPFVNVYILLKIVGRPGWWLILFFIPFVSIIISIVVMMDLAKSFGKGILFAVGLILLGPIFTCFLGFGDAQYQGPSAG